MWIYCLHHRKTELTKNIVLANGDRIRVLGQVTMSLETGLRSFNHNFVVAETNEPVILGNDFLSNNCCVIDVANSSLSIDGKSVPCVLESKVGSLFRLRLAEDIEVPGNSEMILPGYFSDSSDTVLPECLMIESSERCCKRGIVLAKALVSTDSSVVPVRAMNPSDECIKLHKETILGECSIVQDIRSVGEADCSKLDSVTLCSTNGDLPEHIEPVFAGFSSSLNEDQRRQAKALLLSHSDLFAQSKLDRGKTHLVKHKIDTGGHAPIKQRPRRLPLAKRKVEREEIDKMLETGVIESSCSPWASPVVLVTKKDGSIRYCIDYRRLNNITIKDSYPLPHPQDCLESLREAKWFSTLDLQSGYWQIEMDPEDREKTAFASLSGLFQFCVMPFGLTNAPSTFERLMDRIFQGLNPDICLIYLDDIIVKGSTFQEHLNNLREVFTRLRAAGLKLSPKKCELFRKEVRFLGHIVSAEGIRTDPQKTETVLSWPIPRSLKELRSFLGLCSYYRKFIRNFSTLAKPLHRLTEKNVKFHWSIDCQNAFSKLKEALVEATVLAYPDPKGNFILDTDASGVGLGAILSQEQDGHERVIGYYSRSLTKSERHYCVTRRELLAVVDALKHFHTYLYGVPFVVRSDHGSLRWLLNFRDIEGQLGRWSEYLGTYNFQLVHRAGRLHGNADSLSRRPCSDCRYCDKVEMKVSQCVEDECSCSNVRTVSMQGVTEAWIEGKTSTDICEAQEKDPYIGIVKAMIETDQRPKWVQIAHQNSVVKAYWSQWDRLVLRDDILYRKWWPTGKRNFVLQLVLPESLRGLALNQLHDQASSGHLGIRRTLARMRSRFYWVGCKSDVIVWCQSCEVCQRRKSPVRKFRGPMQQYNVGAPLERVALDILGPLPETYNGNRYILVISDYFSRWVEAFGMPDQEASTVADCLVQGFVSRFGVPSQIHSDQGAQFESNLFQALCRILGIEKTRTTPYHPQSDGLVERFNRTLEDMLSKVVETNHKNWDDCLPLAMMAYRSSIHETTGESPVRMMLGRDIQLPVDLMLGKGIPETQSVVSGVAYVKELRENLHRIHDIAREKLLKSSDRQRKAYDFRKNFKSYAVGDTVYLHNSARKQGTSSKFHLPWTGPFLVVGKVSDLVYQIQRSSKSDLKYVHHDRLKPAHVRLDSWLQGSNDKVL